MYCDVDLFWEAEHMAGTCMQARHRQARTTMAQSAACICTCHNTCATPAPPHMFVILLVAAVSQHCIASLHRVQATLHVLHCLSHHCGTVSDHSQSSRRYVPRQVHDRHMTGLPHNRSTCAKRKPLCDMSIIARKQEGNHLEEHSARMSGDTVCKQRC